MKTYVRAHFRDGKVAIFDNILLREEGRHKYYEWVAGRDSAMITTIYDYEIGRKTFKDKIVDRLDCVKQCWVQVSEDTK